MRYAACIEYDGAHFSGWQAQRDSVRTVQETLEAALSKLADRPTTVITAGRTDRGVHATHQIIHFDSEAQRTDFAWCRGTNRFLEHDIRVHWVVPVNNEFHARFGALARSYRFIIHSAPIQSALYRSHTTHTHTKLDASKMALASKLLIGEHDFSSFRAAGCQAQSPIRTIHSIELRSQGDWVWFDITANAFLQHMVRNIAGCLIEVGSGKRSIEWISEVLSKQDRTQGGVTAQPNGLYLVGVRYPDKYALPSAHRSVAYWGNE